MSIKKKPCGLHCIKVKKLGVTADGKTILENIDLHIHCGRLNVIIGKNGAGKSTLLRAILGEVPHTGEVEFTAHGDETAEKLKIGYIPQTLNIDKNTPASVYDLICCYQERRPLFLWKSKKLYAQIKQQLDLFEAGHLIDKQIGRLSGGELQRVLLAMATMDEPNLLIMDEPVSGMDRNGIELFYKNVESLKEEYDLAIILVSHDLEYVAKYADEVILLDKQVKQCGTVKKVYESKEFKEIFGQVRYEMSARPVEGLEDMACNISD